MPCQPRINRLGLEQRLHNLPTINREQSSFCQPKQDVFTKVLVVQAGDQHLRRTFSVWLAQRNPHRQGRVALVDQVGLRTILLVAFARPASRRTNPDHSGVGDLLTDRGDLRFDLAECWGCAGHCLVSPSSMIQLTLTRMS